MSHMPLSAAEPIKPLKMVGRRRPPPSGLKPLQR